MSPEKIAIAVAVTIAAIAGIGAMKKVTGTSSAVAVVAVSPGTAPTKRPNSEAPTITNMLYGVKTSPKACSQASLMSSPRPAASPRDRLQDAPRQRNAQQLVERVVDQQGQHQRERDDQRGAHAQHPHQGGQVERPGQHEAEPIDDHQVEHADDDQHDEAEALARGARP